MKEIYLGTEEDQHFIRDYLRIMRSITPYEMFLTRNVASLKELEASGGDTFDFEFFEELVRYATKCMHDEYSQEFELIPASRYFIGEVGGEDWGGFHSEKAVGYHHVFRSGFAVSLNCEKFPNPKLRTLELARNYLHDSIHHSTFCSFRRLIRAPLRRMDTKRVMPEVYRMQYGINFRNVSGISYSSPKATHRVPAAINLNLLMDGVGVDAISVILNRTNAADVVSLPSAEAEQVFNEVLLQVKQDEPSKWGEDFYFEVIAPSRMFVEHWGSDGFRKLILRAMLEGDLAPLHKYWNDRHGREDAWERVFRQPGYTPDDQ